MKPCTQTCLQSPLTCAPSACTHVHLVFHIKIPLVAPPDLICKSWLHLSSHFFLYTIFIHLHPPSCNLSSTSFWACQQDAGNCWTAFCSESLSCPKEEGTTRQHLLVPSMPSKNSRHCQGNYLVLCLVSLSSSLGSFITFYPLILTSSLYSVHCSP